MTDLNFSGKRVVVTGAATGVGAALLDVLAELGSPAVTVLDVKEPTGPHATYLRTDLSDPAAVDAAVADTLPPETVFRVNVLAPLRVTEALLPQIPDGGTVVVTASIAGLNWRQRLEPILELLALDGWEDRFAWFDGRELGVFTINHAGGRLVSPREVAAVLAWLASPASSFVSGQNVNIDAGFEASMITGQLDTSSVRNR